MIFDSLFISPDPIDYIILQVINLGIGDLEGEASLDNIRELTGMSVIFLVAKSVFQ